MKTLALYNNKNTDLLVFTFNHNIMQSLNPYKPFHSNNQDMFVVNVPMSINNLNIYVNNFFYDTTVTNAVTLNYRGDKFIECQVRKDDIDINYVYIDLSTVVENKLFMSVDVNYVENTDITIKNTKKTFIFVEINRSL